MSNLKNQNEIDFLNEIISICDKVKDKGFLLSDAKKLGKKYNISNKRARNIVTTTDKLITIPRGSNKLIFTDYKTARKYEDKKIDAYTLKENKKVEQFKNFPTKEDFNYCCYRFLNNRNEIIYIGRATNLLDRMKNHKHLSNECYNAIDKIEYTKFNSEDDLDIAERYYIAKYKPRYNEEFKNKNFTFTIDFLDSKYWKELKYIYGLNKIKKNS